MDRNLEIAWRDVINTRADRQHAEQALRSCTIKARDAAERFAKLTEKLKDSKEAAA